MQLVGKNHIMAEFEVSVAAGALRSERARSVTFSHQWTAEGVTVEADFTGAHLLHLAAAGCLLNDTYREAAAAGIVIDGVRVRAWGGFDTDVWASTGIEYAVEIRSDAPATVISRLLERVDEVAEIPRAIRHGAGVQRVV